MYTSQNINLYLPQTNLAAYQKRVYYLGIKNFNSLPSNIKNFSNNPTKFKTALKILCTNSFYLLDE
jgi:hypothetical protein